MSLERNGADIYREFTHENPAETAPGASKENELVHQRQWVVFPTSVAEHAF